MVWASSLTCGGILGVSNWENTTGIQIQNIQKGLYVPCGICAIFLRLLSPWPGPGQQRNTKAESHISWLISAVFN